MRIRRLPPEIAGKIAAGEVIERPASVVKELVENALDAGSTRITVEIERGGKELIRVSDDGAGIPADEVELALARHSTSKLTTVEDLSSIATLGFRGEALASIATVAELTLTSVTASGATGRRVVAHDERVVESAPVGGPAGTQATVRGLFRSLPARLEFLKADRTELGHIVSVVTHAAIGYPEVAFRLLDGANERLRTPGSGDLRATLLALYGAELLDGLIELPPGATLGIDGFVSQPHLHQPSRRYISLFVNRRWVSDRLLAGAISDAYKSLIPSGRFPVVVLRLTMPPAEVDVNVHPTKAEVRFQRGGEVFGKVSATIRRSLMSEGEIVPARLDQPVVDQFFFPTGAAGGWRSGAPPPSRELGAGAASAGAEETEGAMSPDALRSQVMRPLGQIEQTYIVAVGPNGLYLIDQHAAHERVLYEQILHADDGAAQRLLDPVSVELPAAESEWVTEHLKELRRQGLQLEAFGVNAWLVRSVPDGGRPIEPEAYLRAVVAEAQQPEFRRLEAGERVRWSLACQAAVKAGDSLALDEMRELLQRLEQCDLSRVCPHGRPTTILLSREMLDRQFGRA